MGIVIILILKLNKSCSKHKSNAKERSDKGAKLARVRAETKELQKQWRRSGFAERIIYSSRMGPFGSPTNLLVSQGYVAPDISQVYDSGSDHLDSSRHLSPVFVV